MGTDRILSSPDRIFPECDWINHKFLSRSGSVPYLDLFKPPLCRVFPGCMAGMLESGQRIRSQSLCDVHLLYLHSDTRIFPAMIRICLSPNTPGGYGERISNLIQHLDVNADTRQQLHPTIIPMPSMFLHDRDSLLSPEHSIF